MFKDVNSVTEVEEPVYSCPGFTFHLVRRQRSWLIESGRGVWWVRVGDKNISSNCDTPYTFV